MTELAHSVCSVCKNLFLLWDDFNNPSMMLMYDDTVENVVQQAWAPASFKLNWTKGKRCSNCMNFYHQVHRNLSIKIPVTQLLEQYKIARGTDGEPLQH